MHAEVEVHGGADRRGAQGARGGRTDGGIVPPPGHLAADAVPLEGEVRRLKALEDENRRLKKLVANQALDIDALKDVLSKNW